MLIVEDNQILSGERYTDFVNWCISGKTHSIHDNILAINLAYFKMCVIITRYPTAERVKNIFNDIPLGTELFMITAINSQRLPVTVDTIIVMIELFSKAIANCLSEEPFIRQIKNMR
jgi:hypothetical protein